jgi:lipoprotein-releasing system permease protein
MAHGLPYSPQTAQDLAERLRRAGYFCESALDALDRYAPVQPVVDRLQEELTRRQTASGAAAAASAASQAGPPAGASADQIDELQRKLGQLTESSGYLTSDYHAILGLGIEGLMCRTPAGQTLRFLLPGDKIVLTLVPMGRRLSATVTPNTATFLVVDDARTDVASIDSSIVYLPFDTLQLLNDLGPDYAADDNRLLTPARTRQIHVKVRPDIQGEAALRLVRDQIQALWNEFASTHPLAGADVEVRTWRQQQAAVVEPIETQRTLTVIMFSIISLVSVVLIFVIFYMIVFQKTRDIGVLKSIGASSGGVAAIFLTYGAAIGLAGSILGAVGGYYFVRYINPIQDAVDRWFGFRVWSREVFMFDQIPNQVQMGPALMIVAGAIAAGLLGALLPSIRAARMQPVEALRYE